jgi:hypothetical protein
MFHKSKIIKTYLNTLAMFSIVNLASSGFMSAKMYETDEV